MEYLDENKDTNQKGVAFNHQNEELNGFEGFSNPISGVSPGLPIRLINPNYYSFIPQFVQINPLFVLPVRPRLDPEVLFKMELERSMSLLKFMADEGLVPSAEEEIKRKNAIHKLKQIVMTWIKRVANQRQLPRHHVEAASATILTYGSYGLGVHNSESDIDALCIGPCFATLAEDFFIILHSMLTSRPEVSDIHCVKDAKVPLMRFKFDGIPIDLPYAQLKVRSVPENVDVFNPYFLRNIDETSWKSLSGVRANKSLLFLVPNVELFQSVLRCVKLWAKSRGVYGNLLGYFGGIHLAVLVAFVCQRHPNASLSALVSIFYKTFAFWRWPTPVILEDGISRVFIPIDTRSLMPIHLPCSSNEYCHSNITRSTFCRIRSEFQLAHSLTKDILRPEFHWSMLFEPFPYTRKYPRFVKIFLSASHHDELWDWLGWVKSRFRCLLVKLEELQGFCDPNPTEYVDNSFSEPNVVFYWGLQPGRRNAIDVKPVEEDFRTIITNGYQGPLGKIELSVVKASLFPKTPQFDITRRKGTKTCWRVSQKNEPIKLLCGNDSPQSFSECQETVGDAGYSCPGG